MTCRCIPAEATSHADRLGATFAAAAPHTSRERLRLTWATRDRGMKAEETAPGRNMWTVFLLDREHQPLHGPLHDGWQRALMMVSAMSEQQDVDVHAIRLVAFDEDWVDVEVELDRAHGA